MENQTDPFTIPRTSPVSTKSLGEKLSGARRAAGLTQERLATRAGLHRGTVADLEGGRRANLCLSSAVALAKALGIPLFELLPGDVTAGQSFSGAKSPYGEIKP